MGLHSVQRRFPRDMKQIRFTAILRRRTFHALVYGAALDRRSNVNGELADKECRAEPVEAPSCASRLLSEGQFAAVDGGVFYLST